MTERISYQDVDPNLFSGMYKTEHYLKKSGMDLKLLELVKYRVSQINGCAYCLDMHHKEAIHMGETELRLHSVAAWRDCPYYSPEERAAFAFAEALTQVDRNEVDEEVFEGVAAHFTKDQVAVLTVAITQINAWNRINRAFRTTPGNYKIGQFD